MERKKKGSTFFYVIMMLALVGIITFAMMNLVLSDIKSAKHHRQKQQEYYTAFTVCEALADSVVDNGNDLIQRFEDEIRDYKIAYAEYEEGLNKSLKNPKKKPHPHGKKSVNPPQELKQSDFSYRGINYIENNEVIEITTVLDISPLILQDTKTEDKISSELTVMFLTFTAKYKGYEVVSRLKTETDFLTIDGTTRPQWKKVEFYEK